MHHNYEKANLAPRCVHTCSTGLPCTQPALRGRRFCRFHDPISARNRRFVLPIIEDGASLQVAIAEIVHALVAGQMDRRSAEVAMQGLRLAATNMKNFQAEMHTNESCEER